MFLRPACYPYKKKKMLYDLWCLSDVAQNTAHNSFEFYERYYLSHLAYHLLSVLTKILKVMMQIWSESMHRILKVSDTLVQIWVQHMQ